MFSGHFSILTPILFSSSDVEDVVAPNQHLPQVASAGPIDELLGVRQLEVHVPVAGDQEPL